MNERQEVFGKGGGEIAHPTSNTESRLRRAWKSAMAHLKDGTKASALSRLRVPLAPRQAASCALTPGTKILLFLRRDSSSASLAQTDLHRPTFDLQPQPFRRTKPTSFTPSPRPRSLSEDAKNVQRQPSPGCCGQTVSQTLDIRTWIRDPAGPPPPDMRRAGITVVHLYNPTSFPPRQV